PGEYWIVIQPVDAPPLRPASTRVVSRGVVRVTVRPLPSMQTVLLCDVRPDGSAAVHSIFQAANTNPTALRAVTLADPRDFRRDADRDHPGRSPPPRPRRSHRSARRPRRRRQRHRHRANSLPLARVKPPGGPLGGVAPAVTGAPYRHRP